MNQSKSATVIEKRAAANRQNALKSTGPQTTVGKLVVAGNGIAHGIYAISPVVAGMESLRDWNIYRMEMMVSFAPLGMLETTLAERIILTAWRQRRVARYESEHLRSEQQAAQEHVGKELLLDRDEDDDDHDAAEAVGTASWRLKWLERCLQCAKLLTDGSADAPVEMNDAKDLLLYVETRADEEAQAQLYLSGEGDLDSPVPSVKSDQQFENPERWTVSLLRQRVRPLAEKFCTNGDSFGSLVKKINKEGWEVFKAVKRAKRRLNEYRHEHLLPDERTLERVMRYEAHLSRQLHRDLHELQRLQAMRQGQPVLAPVAIDIDVASDLKTASENGD
jgi:hypothetical protein